jgi:hypothetical protein
MPARARAEPRFAAPIEDPDHAMPSRHRRRLPRPLLFLASLLPVAAAGCVQDGPYGSYDPHYAERARAWQQEEAARRADAAARYSDFEAERQARWREEMERRRAWAAQQRAWERARRAELGGGYGTRGGEVMREDLPPGAAPPYRKRGDEPLGGCA